MNRVSKGSNSPENLSRKSQFLMAVAIRQECQSRERSERETWA